MKRVTVLGEAVRGQAPWGHTQAFAGAARRGRPDVPFAKGLG